MLWYALSKKEGVMPKKSPVIQLSDDEYLQLRQYVREGKKSSRTITRARVLLLSDEHVPDEDICQQLDIGRVTVYRIRRKYHDGGLTHALHDKRRSGAPSKIDGRVEASLTMLACSAPPEGYGRWTLQLLADKLIELKVIDAISLESVRTTLKKTNSNRG
jgi:putative transposase